MSTLEKNTSICKYAGNMPLWMTSCPTIGFWIFTRGGFRQGGNPLYDDFCCSFDCFYKNGAVAPLRWSVMVVPGQRGSGVAQPPVHHSGTGGYQVGDQRRTTLRTGRPPTHDSLSRDALEGPPPGAPGPARESGASARKWRRHRALVGASGAALVLGRSTSGGERYR
jgi:hypothetical protein